MVRAQATIRGIRDGMWKVSPCNDTPAVLVFWRGQRTAGASIRPLEGLFVQHIIQLAPTVQACHRPVGDVA